MDRRNFLRAALTASAGFVLPQTLGCNFTPPVPGELPAPRDSGIEHVVVTMMENRSFDHLFGWLPNADGKQAGLSYADASGIVHPTFPLAPDYTGCGHDPDHSYAGGRTEYNSGAMDGFLKTGPDLYAVGYYVEKDRPFHSQLARTFTVLDRYFCSVLGPTTPNRMFLHAAQSDRISNTIDLATMPTIWDRLNDAGVSRRYYFQNANALAVWGTKYDAITGTLTDFLLDVQAGKLPAVSMIEPLFSFNGRGNDDHPPADVRAGDAFLAMLYRALTSSRTWKSTVWIITYDEWGGYFDHVAPPRAAAANPADTDLVAGKSLLGFRVPVVVVSPWTRGSATRNRVNSLTYDHASVLKLIEWRWDLPPLSARDASDDIGNLAHALDFLSVDASVPEMPTVSDPNFPGCS
jgi:phospholipase C